MRALGAILMIGFSLSGCGSGAEDGSAQPPVVIPSFVQKMVDADFAADGQIHVQSVGKFEIKPTSMQCIADPEIADSLVKLNVHFVRVRMDDIYKNLGQSNQLENFNARYGQLNVNCTDDGTNQVSRWILRNGHNDKPYKLILAVWQGDVAWVGGVERFDGRRTDIVIGYVNEEPTADIHVERLQSMSSEKDTNDISGQFTRTLLGSR
jgi:hypothetical protein